MKKEYYLMIQTTDSRIKQYYFQVSIYLVIFTLLVLTSCSNASSSHPNSNATATTPVANGTTIANPYPPHQGTLVLNDSLVDNSHGFKWDQRNSSCQFSSSAYHASTSIDSYSYFCVAYGTNFSNFTYEVEMTILKGDAGGLFFRGDANNSKFYYLQFDPTGSFRLIIYTGHTSSGTLAEGTISAFHTGLGQSNLIAVAAQQDRLALYVNHQLIKVVTNSTLSQGQIGLVATDYDHPTEVAFTDAKVWKLS
jgi:hypothetical protein